MTLKSVQKFLRWNMWTDECDLPHMCWLHVFSAKNELFLFSFGTKHLTCWFTWYIPADTLLRNKNCMWLYNHIFCSSYCWFWTKHCGTQVNSIPENQKHSTTIFIIWTDLSRYSSLQRQYLRMCSAYFYNLQSSRY